jgi:hypothetical protein
MVVIRDSPDDAKTLVNDGAFPASLQDKREELCAEVCEGDFYLVRRLPSINVFAAALVPHVARRYRKTPACWRRDKAAKAHRHHRRCSTIARPANSPFAELST